MVDNYLELKFYDFKKTKHILYFLLSLILILTIFSNMKISKYVSFNLVKDNNSLYIECNHNCNVIKEKSTLLLYNRNINYLFKNKINNLFEITILDDIKINNNSNIKIRLQKESELNALFNIFKKKGV